MSEGINFFHEPDESDADAAFTELAALRTENEQLKIKISQWEEKARQWLLSDDAKKQLAGYREMSEQITALHAKNDRLQKTLSSLDCRYAGGGLADLTGSHCPPDKPCERCKNERLQTALGKCALPYEALLTDKESRKWIAPEVWSSIEKAVTSIHIELKI